MGDWKKNVGDARDALVKMNWNSRDDVLKLHDRVAVPLQEAVSEAPDDKKCHLKQVLRIYQREPAVFLPDAPSSSWVERLWDSKTGNECKDLKIPEASLEFLKWLTVDAVKYLDSILDVTDPSLPKLGFTCRINSPVGRG